MSVDVPLGPLLEPAFHVGSVPTTWAELLGFGTGAVNVWLVVRQNILNWPIGIANVILLGLVFLDGGLYADSGLQVFYVGLQLYGWWMWLYGGDGRDNLPVRRTRRGEWAALVTAGAAATALLTWALSAWTDSTVAFWDALTTAISLMAVYGQSRKLLESWWLWITADLVYIPLYLYKDLKLTAVLYVIFLTLCVFGLRAWRRDLRARTAGGPAPVPA
ncbi:nicotinamide mononucleotide transporter [Actinomadura hallensis]|uniref:Nicotinamide mononucleotide transporter n=1 Tax=Actinomadura hallensis TaxID=337895 RepID=A0A543ICK0_9ACTN|nr:nicotinamide riboside transporter PnuC [Actinomadura hallensis]TQM68261.1 nicotinamide mononucleotide transporter [Actinomadura hallensis]HLV72249.1 nicotinamide riboside transporter PnuC [Vulgatibacteraceae bacterium]